MKSTEQKLMPIARILIFSSMCFIFILIGKESKAQNFLQIWNHSGAKSLLWDDLVSNIGLNTATPNANFHIFESFLTTNPFLKLEQNTGGPITSNNVISFLFSDPPNHVDYGISQLSGDPKLINYLQSPLLIGKALYTNDVGANTQGVVANLGAFYFRLSALTPSQLSQLTIDNNGIIVGNKTRTYEFQLYDNAALGRVLVSDQDGNGIWTDASVFNDKDWLVTYGKKEGDPGTEEPDLYCNPIYKKVGIGTDQPLQSLHVVNGNILISRQSGQKKEFGSLNGSMLFGEVVTGKNPNGEWGIEYYNPDPADQFPTGGLNFWKVGNPENQGSNYI